MKLGLTLKQAQRLSPQTLLSVRILQKNAQELGEYLEDLALENPAIEINKQENTDMEANEVAQKLTWLGQRRSLLLDVDKKMMTNGPGKTMMELLNQSKIYIILFTYS